MLRMPLRRWIWPRASLPERGAHPTTCPSVGVGDDLHSELRALPHSGIGENLTTAVLGGCFFARNLVEWTFGDMRHWLLLPAVNAATCYDAEDEEPGSGAAAHAA